MKGASTLASPMNSVVLLLVKGWVKKWLCKAEHQTLPGTGAVDGNDVVSGVERRSNRSEGYGIELQESGVNC